MKRIWSVLRCELCNYVLQRLNPVKTNKGEQKHG